MEQSNLETASSVFIVIFLVSYDYSKRAKLSFDHKVTTHHFNHTGFPARFWINYTSYQTINYANLF